jgi:hypothetical protein
MDCTYTDVSYIVPLQPGIPLSIPREGDCILGMKVRNKKQGNLIIHLWGAELLNFKLNNDLESVPITINLLRLGMHSLHAKVDCGEDIVLHITFRRYHDIEYRRELAKSVETPTLDWFTEIALCNSQKTLKRNCQNDK